MVSATSGRSTRSLQEVFRPHVEECLARTSSGDSGSVVDDVLPVKAVHRPLPAQ